MQVAVMSLLDSVWLLRWCVRVSQLKNSTTNSELAFRVSVSIRVFFSSVIPLPVTIIVFSCVVLCDQQANSIAFSVHNLKTTDRWLVLCQVAKMQVGSGSGNFRQNRVGSVRVQSGNVNEKLLNFLLRALLNADKSADWTKFRLKASPWTQWIIARRTKWRPDLDSACPKTPKTTIFLTKSMTLNFAKKLFTLGTYYKAIPDPEPTLPAYYPTYPTQSTHR